jgi:hypothetical protein
MNYRTKYKSSNPKKPVVLMYPKLNYKYTNHTFQLPILKFNIILISTLLDWGDHSLVPNFGEDARVEDDHRNPPKWRQI